MTEGRAPLKGYTKAVCRRNRLADEFHREATGHAIGEFRAFHDFRVTLRSKMPELGVRPDVAEAVLGHVQGGIEGVYNRYSYADEKREALDKFGEFISSICGVR